MDEEGCGWVGGWTLRTEAGGEGNECIFEEGGPHNVELVGPHASSSSSSSSSSS